MRLAQLVRLAFLPAAISIASTPLFAQGDTGFLRGVGKWDLAMTYTNDSYDEFWVGDDKVSDPAVGEVTRETWSIYSAYGLRDDMDLVLSAAYVEASSDGAGGFSDENELQDWSFGIKWAFWKQRVGSGEASMLFAPSIKDPLTGYEDNAVTAIGDGQTDLRGRVIAHYQLDNGLFGSLESGYDWRDSEPDDEVPVNLTLGGTIADRVTIMPFYSLVNSLGGIDISDIPPGSFPETEEDTERVGVGAYVRLTAQLGLSGRWLTTLDGKNTGDVDSYSFGFVFRML